MAKMRNEAMTLVYGDANTHYEEMMRQLHHKNDKESVLAAAIYPHLARQAVNH